MVTALDERITSLHAMSPSKLPVSHSAILKIPHLYRSHKLHMESPQEEQEEENSDRQWASLEGGVGVYISIYHGNWTTCGNCIS